MPVGAAIGTAVVGGGAAILGSKAQKSAAGQAADQQAASTAAQLQLGRESLALNKDIYGANFGLLSPYVSRGNVAGDQINALLGLPSAPAIANPLAPSAAPGMTPVNPLAAEWARIQSMQGNGVDNDFENAALQFVTANGLPAGYSGPSLAQIAAMGNDGIPGNSAAALASIGNAITANAPAPAAPAPATPGAARRAANATTTPQSATAAFEQFANSAGMKFQQDQAASAINNGYAGAGALQSGAAMKAISDRSEDVALNNYFLPYMSLLGGQQSTGAGAAGAVAGVGANFGNTAAGINGNMGNAIQGGANNLGNLALANGQNQANMWANLGSSFGTALGAFK